MLFERARDIAKKRLGSAQPPRLVVVYGMRATSYRIELTDDEDMGACSVERATGAVLERSGASRLAPTLDAVAEALNETFRMCGVEAVWCDVAGPLDPAGEAAEDLVDVLHALHKDVPVPAGQEIRFEMVDTVDGVQGFFSLTRVARPFVAKRRRHPSATALARRLTPSNGRLNSLILRFDVARDSPSASEIARGRRLIRQWGGDPAKSLRLR